MNEYQINIVHLYPDLLNLYGDKGNIECLRKRLQWRGIGVNVTTCTNQDGNIDFADTDIIFVGGGSDRDQELVCGRLLEKQKELKNYVENNGVLIAVCGGYQLLGRYYKTAEKTIEGLSLLNIETDSAPNRLIGNIVLESPHFSQKIVGFENHAGRTNIHDYEPLGKVVFGHGNDDTSGYEGVIYKNVIGTYLHGPLLPKNPMLCDDLLTRALKKKYSDFESLTSLDDSLENTANEYIVKRFAE